MKTMRRRDFLGWSAVSAGAAFLGACASTAITLPANEIAQAVPAATTVPTATSLPDVTTLPAATNTPEAVVVEPTATAIPTTLASNMVDAAQRFLSSVGQSNPALFYTFGSQERVRWHWTTPSNVPRNGLPLTAMNDTQRTLAFDLLDATIPAAAVQKAIDIMSLQNELGNDPGLYYFTLFGTPNADNSGIDYAQPWAWRVEGHHLSRHFTVINGQVIMTPLFLGARPTQTASGLRAMPVEEDAALQLVNSLTGGARNIAIVQQQNFRPHVTSNAVQVNPLDQIGLAYADMGAGQQQNVMQIISAYLMALPPELATAHMNRIQQAGVGSIRFAWSGGTEIRTSQYYRLQGPTFLLEYDNSRNNGTHIHSVWRDFNGDFGLNLLA